MLSTLLNIILMLLNYYSRKIKNAILITSEFKSKTNIFVKVLKQDIRKLANRYTLNIKIGGNRI